MGRSGRHRHRHDRHGPKTLRISLITTAGLTALALAATLVALGRSGSSSAQANAQAGTDTQTRAGARYPSRDHARTPLPTPSETPSERDPIERTKHHKKTEVLSHGSCEASFYGSGGRTASGEALSPSALTAAHRTLPIGSKVRVRNRNNDRSVVVRINDRGPFVPGRCLDLSTAAMRAVGGLASGVIPVSYEVLANV